MSVTVSSYKNIVGGEWVDSASGETMEVVNPATGEAIAEVPRGTKDDADHAVELPADDGGLEVLARAGRRQHAGAEAGRADAADHTALLPARDGGGDPAPRSPERDHRRRRAGRRGDRQAPRRPSGLAHRGRRDWQDH